MSQQFFEYYDKPASAEPRFYRYCPRCATALVSTTVEHHPRRSCPACGFIQHLNPLPGVCVVIEQAGRVLIGRRTQRSTRGGLWCLPCGFIDHEESYLQAAHREVKEETGLEIRLTGVMDIYSNHITPAMHSLVPVLTATVVGGEEQAGDDIDELRWVSPSCALPEMAFISDPLTIARFFADDFTALPIDDRFALSMGLSMKLSAAQPVELPKGSPGDR